MSTCIHTPSIKYGFLTAACVLGINAAQACSIIPFNPSQSDVIVDGPVRILTKDVARSEDGFAEETRGSAKISPQVVHLNRTRIKPPFVFDFYMYYDIDGCGFGEVPIEEDGVVRVYLRLEKNPKPHLSLLAIRSADSK